jgi:uncharacterized protein (DUF302 family)
MERNMPIKTFLKAAAMSGIMSLAAIGHSFADDWVIKDSASDVVTTADKLVAAVGKAGATVFARVDHAAGAESIDAELDPMTLVIFGNPKLGTPIMKAEPKAGLDLPVRVLIWEAEGTTKIGYLEPDELKDRYDVEGADKAFEMMTGALNKLTDAAAK